MKVFQEKTKKIQNSPTEKVEERYENNGTATIQDNRFTPIHQLKLKNRMRLGNPNVLQFKALDKEVDSGRLNVVGENHLESGGRREEEKKYAKKVFGFRAKIFKRYWTEGEFSFSQNNKKEYGDDPQGRIDFMVIRALINLKKYSNYKEVLSDLEGIEHENKKMEIKNPLAENLSRIAKNVSYELLKMTNETEPLVVGVTEYLNSRFPTNQPDFDDVNEMEEFKKDISNSRGIYMLEKANAAVEKGIKGIWKVGDNHIHQIHEAENEEEERSFNLISMDTFNEIYGAYKSKKNKK